MTWQDVLPHTNKLFNYWHRSPLHALKTFTMKKNTLLLMLLMSCCRCLCQDFQESFDAPGITAPTGPAWALPDSGTWHIFDNGTGTQQSWTLNTSGTYPAHSQPRAAYINRENIGQGNTSRDYLATPLITLPTDPQLRFRTRTTLQPQNGTIFEVRAASAVSDPTLPSSYTTLVASWTEADLTQDYDVYEEKIVNMTLPEPAMYLAFVRVHTQTGSGVGGDRWLIDDVVVTGRCLDVQNITADPSTTSAVLSWDSPGPATQWEVHVLPAGMPLTSPFVGTPLLTAAPNANTGLTVNQTTLSPSAILSPGTAYVVWIRPVCMYEQGEWISSPAFTTDVLPSTCGGNYVDNGGIDGNYLPDTNTITTICPGPGEVVTVTFTHFDTEPGFDGIYVYDGDSVNAPQIMSINGVGYGIMTAPGAYWGNQVPGPFTATNADGCLTFRFLSGGSVNQSGFLANITCSPAPSCQKPTGVTVTQTTLDTATVSWTPVGTATQWLVYALPCGSAAPAAGSPGGISTMLTTLTLENLDPSTCYDIFVFAVCDGPSYSEPTLPQTAVTLVPEPVCGGIFMDPAGPMDYAANTDYTVTICPDVPGDMVTVEFTEFDIQHNFDGMYVYDGDSTDAPQFDSGNTGGWLPNILEPGAYWGTQAPGPFVATSESGCLTFHFMSNQNFNGAGWKANVTCEPPPPCPKPTALAASLPLPTKATVSWTNVGPATSWEVIAVLCGSPAPEDTAVGVNTTDNPFVYEGLDPDTCYEFYVRGNCSSTGNGMSAWAGPVSLTTEPAPPVCGGVFKDEGGDGNYPQVSTSVVTIYPENAGDMVTVFFTLFALYPAGGDVLYVYDGPTTSSPQIASSNGPGDTQYPNVQQPGGFWGTELPGPFEATNPLGCLTFEFKSNNALAWVDTSAQGWTADVVCNPAPTCAKPTSVTVTAVTQTSVTVDWIETGTATQWQVLVLPYDAPFPLPGATGWQTANVKPFTYGPLTPGLRYKVYVRAACGADDVSTWSYHEDFHTPISNDFCEGAITLPVNGDAYCGQIVEATLFGSGVSGLSAGDEYPCIGNDNVDVWFKFVATGTEHYIKMNNVNAQGQTVAASPGFSLFSGDCQGGLTYMACYAGTLNASLNHIIADNLVPGNTYYLQAFAPPGANYDFNVCIGTLPEVIATSEEFTTEQLVHDILLDATCAIITNVTSSTGTDFGSANGIGYFNENGSGFPFAEGVVLSTGYVGKVPGPNNTYLSDGANPNGPVPAWTGDTDLEAIILEGTGNPLYSHNATKLEFDFVPVIPFINFNFIFASDEYGYYQCDYSDSFAFILTDLSMPGLPPVNLAVLPNSNVPISVVTIRDTAFNSSCGSQNEAYFGQYYGEYEFDQWGFLPDGIPQMAAPVNFNGMTVPLTAYADVIPGHQYHIKLVIADRGDHSMDSAVFIEAGSFDIGSIDLGADLLIAYGTAVCAESYTINTGLSQNSYTFVWKNGDAVIEGATGPSLTVTAAGSYTVTSTFNNSECSSSDTVTVEFYTSGLLNQPQDVTQCGAYTLPVPAVGHYYAGPGGQGAILDGTVISALGERMIYIYYSAGPNCTEEFGFMVTITESFELPEIEDVYSCGPYALPELDGVRYYNGPGATGGEITTVMATQAVYAYMGGGSAGCSAEQAFMVFVTDVPRIEITGGCNGNEYVLKATVLNAVPDVVYDHAWSNDDGTIVSGHGTEEVIVSGAGTYHVTVSLDGCDGSGEKWVSGTSCLIQKGISPNGDGLNDVFDLKGYDVAKLQIFNRYGKKLYEKGPYLNEWDGRSDSGDQLPDGTYFYVIEFNGDRAVETGWIYLALEN